MQKREPVTGRTTQCGINSIDYNSTGRFHFLQMNDSVPLERKLTINLLVEPGCLGSRGKELICDFCDFTQKIFEAIGSDYLMWTVGPRYDKSHPEVRYSVNNKNLNTGQTEKYLLRFSLEIEVFEEQLNDRVAFIIDYYHNHHKIS